MGGYGGVAFYGIKVERPDDENKLEKLLGGEDKRIDFFMVYDGSFDPDCYVIDRDTMIDQDAKDNMIRNGKKEGITKFIRAHGLKPLGECGLYLVKHEIY